ncbi:MAG TPA: DNA replication/repair protein RecF [Candidatus Saccharimonadales bacterium]|nr:DNA replication/repair protein RecF [Candidatus Saccharimonadales bacterium]
MFGSVSLHNFRSYTNYDVEFSPGVTVIVGPNGSGKTNLLEALYVLSAGSSFRGVDRDMIRHGEPWLKIEGVYNDQKRTIVYKVQPEKLEKQFDIDGSKKARLTHQYKLPVVLFEPDHLRLLRSSPTGRRDFLDNLLARIHPDFTWTKHQYERVLQQRNSLLKNKFGLSQVEDQLFAWDVRLADLGAVIVERRVSLINDLNKVFGEVYSSIAGVKTDLQIEYKSSLPAENYQANLLNALSRNAASDLHRGFTSFGPHRDDFAVKINNKPAAAAASRGEVRSMLLALKIIELKLLAKQNENPPILLLDDVFSELDSTRRRALTDITKTYQTFITTTDADVVEKSFLAEHKIISTEKLQA